MAQDLNTIIGSLAPAYDPQSQLIQQQQQALPGQFQADQQGLDVAKTNAFQGIADNANARGVMYSGVPISEQSKYVGEKYLPAVASLKQSQQDQQFKLQDALNQLTKQRYDQAYGIQQAQQKQDADTAYQQQQLALQQQKYQQDLQLAQVKASGSGRLTATQASQQSFNQDLQGAYQYFLQNPGAIHSGAREQVLQQLTAAYGGVIPNIDKTVYQVFQNGWESKINPKYDFSKR